METSFIIYGHSLAEWFILASLALFLIGKVCALLGFTRGAKVVDELQSAMNEFKTEIKEAKGSAGSIQGISEKIAAQVPGVSAEIVKPLVVQAAHGLDGTVSKIGMDVKIDNAGNISLDPSGLVQNKARKIGKFFKKVF